MFLEKNRGIFLLSSRNLFFLSLILFFLEYFTKIVISNNIRMNLLGFILAFSGFSWLFFYIKKDEKHYKEKLEPFFKYSFLILLFIITLGSLRFGFIQNIGFLKAIIDLISSYTYPLTLLTIGAGFFTFSFNKEVVDEIEKEKTKEEKAERKREKEFASKFPKINKIFGVRRLVKWMYKLGWKFSIPLVIIILSFITIRVGMPIIYGGSYVDEYRHIFSGISLIENQTFPIMHIMQPEGYRRGAPFSLLVGTFIFLFGKNIFVTKLVPTLFGILNFILVLLINKKFIRDKKTMLLFLTFLTFSPYIIFNHFYIRMYIWYEFVLILSIFLFFNLIKNINEGENKKIVTYSILILLLNYILHFWSFDNGKYIILLVNGLLGAYIFFFELHKLKISTLLFLNKFFSLNILWKTTITILLLFFLYLILDIKESLYWFLRGSLGHPAIEGFRYTNLFFGVNNIYTLFFLLSILILFFYKNSYKNSYKNIFISVSITIFVIHLISSPEIQATRVILYFFPLFYLISTFSVSFYLKILNNKFTSIFLIILLYLILINSYPKNFLDGPYIPNEIIYRDYKSPSLFLIEQCENSEIYSLSHQMRYIPFFYNARIDYQIYFREEYLITNPNYHYDYTSQKFRVTINNIEVITELKSIEEKIKNNVGVCFITKNPERDHTWIMTTPEIIDLMESNLEIKKFRDFIVYYKNRLK